jgi:Ca2+-binding RTX toxin-like protein
MRVRVLPILATMVLGVVLLSGVVLAKNKLCHNNCKGTDRDDQIVGDGGKNKLLGLGSRDYVGGKGAADTLLGGTGNDEVQGGNGRDYVHGGSGCDTLWGKVGYDTLKGGEKGCAGLVSSQQGAYQVQGGGRIDRLLGGSGNDILWAKDGKEDIVRGGPGRDTAYVDPGVDTVTGVEVTPGTDPPGNNTPVAEDQSVTTDEDTPKDVTLSASDVDDDNLTYDVVDGPDHGTLSGSGATRTYTPDPNYEGPDSFTFTANDGTADSNVAMVSITVT